MYKIKESYEATVPDTLDLAERSKLAINALMGFNFKSEKYQPYHFTEYYRNPPVISNISGCGGDCACHECNAMWGKYLEALVQMRVASGFLGESDVDVKSFDGLTSHLQDDNLLHFKYRKIDGDKLGEEVGSGGIGAREMVALSAKYQLTGDPAVKEQLRAMVKGCRSIITYKDDYAFFGGEQDGVSMYEHGFNSSSTAVIYGIGGTVQGLCRAYLATEEADALEMAGRLARYILKAKFWAPECDPEAVVSAEHGHFEGHIHATLRGFLGILEYALITNDETLKLFVRDGYEYIRTFGIARIGLFGETCGVGDITALAVKLTDAGVGDYWEDIDQYIRNHLTEAQVLDDKEARAAAASAPEIPVMPWESTENFYSRVIGSLNDDATHPTLATFGYNFCCCYNGYAGFYHVWEGITRCNGDGNAQINLMLNRASEWLDIDSYEPYEGRVVIRNKTAKSISVRIPRFADLSGVSTAVNGKAVQAKFVGRYLVICGTKPGDVIELRYPLPENTATYTLGWPGMHIPGWTESTHLRDSAASKPYMVEVDCHNHGCPEEKYTCIFRGNTLIDISPRATGLGQSLYQRERFKGNNAPMVKVTRNVSENLIDWRI